MKYGEIYALGEHRLMCGDATNRDDVMTLVRDDHIDLVLTDPPYGVSSVDRRTGQLGGKSQVYHPVIGDWNCGMFRDHYAISRVLCNSLVVWGGQNFTDVLPPTSGWLFWDKLKNSPALSFGDGELAWSNVSTRVRKYEHRWNGAGRDGSRELNEKVHPNQKPVELHAHILEDFTKEGDVILDCFGGSGTTLIACEVTMRKCLMMEISPEYCDVILNRWEKLTERRAERITPSEED